LVIEIFFDFDQKKIMQAMSIMTTPIINTSNSYRFDIL
jgi:hypothetical protein